MCFNGAGRAPPFIPAGGLSFCTQFEGASCCTTEEDTQLQQRFNDISARASSDPSAQVCLNQIRELICARCSPYAATLYGARSKEERPKPIPMLCGNYCQNELRGCLQSLSYIVNNTEFISTTNHPDYFCELWSNLKRNETVHCFPDTNRDQQLLQRAREVANGKTSCVCMERFKRGYKNPVLLTYAPGYEGYVFVGEQYGVIRASDKGADEGDLGRIFLNISGTVQMEANAYADQRGLLGLTFHPDFASNRRFYVLYTTRASGTLRTRLSEFTVSVDNRFQADPASQRILLEIDQPRITNNGGDVSNQL